LLSAAKPGPFEKEMMSTFDLPTITRVPQSCCACPPFFKRAIATIFICLLGFQSNLAAIQVETESNTIGQAAKKQVVVSASVAPQAAAPGEKVELVLSVTIPAGYHIYGSRNSNNPTTVELADSTNFSFWLTGTKEIRQQITVAETATGTVEISGEVAFMMCDKNFCKPPAKVAFQTQLTVAATDVDKKATEPKKKLRQTIAKPTETMDYSRLAFFPQRWVERGVSTEMYAWKGEEVCLLTQTNDLDQELMTTFVGNLDRGYKFYRDMVGASPRPSRIWLDKPVIASVPTHRLTCSQCICNGLCSVYAILLFG